MGSQERGFGSEMSVTDRIPALPLGKQEQNIPSLLLARRAAGGSAQGGGRGQGAKVASSNCEREPITREQEEAANSSRTGWGLRTSKKPLVRSLGAFLKNRGRPVLS